MKKSIFTLDKKELKDLFKDFRKSEYYKRYLIEFISLNVIFIIVAGFTLGWFFSCDDYCSQMVELLSGIGYIIIVGIVLIMDVLFIFKKYDLMKFYYDERKLSKLKDIK